MFEFNSFVDYVTFVKKVEYGLAFALMIGFALLYKWSKPVAEADRVFARVKGLVVPEHMAFHPGHAWAGANRGGVVVGIDEFARRLLGRVTNVSLPGPGTVLRRGETAWTLIAGGEQFEIASPVDGVVADVNPALANGFDTLNDDPQGKGWLLRVHTRRLSAMRGLMMRKAAARWLQKTMDELYAATHMEFGMVAADGGEPVDGFAKAADPENWAETARKFLDPGRA